MNFFLFFKCPSQTWPNVVELCLTIKHTVNKHESAHGQQDLKLPIHISQYAF